jgi:hypothetical protein
LGMARKASRKRGKRLGRKMARISTMFLMLSSLFG